MITNGTIAFKQTVKDGDYGINRTAEVSLSFTTPETDPNSEAALAYVGHIAQQQARMMLKLPALDGPQLPLKAETNVALAANLGELVQEKTPEQKTANDEQVEKLKAALAEKPVKEAKPKKEPEPKKADEPVAELISDKTLSDACAKAMQRLNGTPEARGRIKDLYAPLMEDKGKVPSVYMVPQAARADLLKAIDALS